MQFYFAPHFSHMLASADYVSITSDLTFGPSSRKQCVLIPVLNDMVPEVPEHFSVVLSMTTPLAGVILTPDNVTVIINDDDGECSDRLMVECYQNLMCKLLPLTVVVGFERETYSISEGNGSVEVCVKVSGVLQSSLRLSLTTVDGNAIGEHH